MIEAVEVVREKEGGFVHPIFEAFCNDREHIPKEEVEQFEQAHGCVLRTRCLELTENENSAAWRQYFDEEGGFSSWSLDPPTKDSVLLSVHDSENSPIQIWAVPYKALMANTASNLEQPRLVTHHAVGSHGRGDMGQAVIAHGPYSPGGAQNHYVIGVGAECELMTGGAQVLGCISFQDGSPQKVGPNGVTLEAVLACCADRIERFQQGPHANANNAEALQHILYGISHLKSRTLIRDKGGR